MKEQDTQPKEPFTEPKVLASYKKEELEEIIKPHGNGGGGCGSCGCGGGS